MRECVIVGRRDLSEDGSMEYFSRRDGSLWIFHSRNDAEAALQIDGIDSDEIASLTFVRSNKRCRFCGASLFPSDNPDYDWQCFQCDEDFYDFEQRGE